MDSFSEKATSAISEAKESVSTTAETVTRSLTDAEKTVQASTESAKAEAAAATETVKAEAAAAPKKASDVSTQAKEAVDKAFSKGIEGAKNLLHTFEEKRGEVSSKLVGAVTNVVSGSSSSTVANRDLPVSSDNQPLLASGETTPWWKNCCGVLDYLKKDATTN